MSNQGNRAAQVGLLLRKVIIVGAVSAVVVVGGRIIFKAAGNFPSLRVGLPGCEKTTDLTAGADGFRGYEALRSPWLKERLAKECIRLVYQDHPDPAKRIQAVRDGRLDFAFTTVDTISRQPRGLTIAMLNDTSNGADIIVGRTDFKPGEQVEIGYAKNSVSEHLLAVGRQTLQDLEGAQLVPLNGSEDAFKQLESGALSHAVLWEPEASQARKKGYKLLFSSADVPYSVLDVGVVKEGTTKEPAIGKLVGALYSLYDRAAVGEPQDECEFLRIMGNDPGLDCDGADAKALRDELKGIAFYTSARVEAEVKSGTLAKAIRAINDVAALAKDAPGVNVDMVLSQFGAFQANGVTRERFARNPELAKRWRVTTPDGLQAAPAPQDNAKATARLAGTDTIEFETGSAQLTQRGKQTLDRLAGRISNLNKASISLQIDAFASATGDPLFNQQLTVARGQAVLTYLKARGVQLTITSRGHGMVTEDTKLPQYPLDSLKQQRAEIRLFRHN